MFGSLAKPKFRAALNAISARGGAKIGNRMRVRALYNRRAVC